MLAPGLMSGVVIVHERESLFLSLSIYFSVR